MNKARWRSRALAAERDLALRPPLTYDTLTVCFTSHTVSIRGRTVQSDTDCLALPITSDEHLLAPAGWYAINPKVPA